MLLKRIELDSQEPKSQNKDGEQKAKVEENALCPD
jgi:hypothetical protein